MKNKKFNTGIYQIVNLVNGKRYIGSSVDIKNRLNEHNRRLNKNCHHCDYLQRSYNRHGKDNFKFEILLYCSREDLLFYEQRTIDAYNFEDELYNLAPKAGNTVGVRRRPESIAKQKKAMKGRKFSEEHKRNISIALTNKPKSPEHVKKMADSRRGKPLSNEHRLKISITGRNHSPEVNKKKGRTGVLHNRFNKHGKDNPQSKAVYQIDKNTNEIIKEWESVVEASKALKIDQSYVSKICRGQHLSAGGFKWVYVENYENKKGE